ncbi:hypothetical protein PMZ80_010362 [Knufia obscura]|uniref:Uncharacterized protein n=2 Tax=Knufia TaxID=430999 RepID=A0AAN8ETM5_9EURO|nr:hypothetical protein PMZ80_010362 [Knufia obscura]KAK5951868.1 hypothetical protein OHC33_007161 [Knufia fluminis]
MDQPTETPSNGQRYESTPQVANPSHNHHSSHPSILDSPQSPRSATTPRPRSPSQTRLTRPGGSGLNEFSSLLEAAQRIANSAPTGSESESWPNEEQPDPVIRRSSGTEEFRRRVPLTRQYSGRPHIPGEDSGSEEEGDGGPIRPQGARMESYTGRGLPQDARRSTEQTGEIHYDREAQEARQQLQRAAARLRARRDPSEERQRRRDEVMSRMRERARAEEGAANLTREHYSTTGPPPVRESFYDWALEPQETTGASTVTETQTRERSSSVRRWRPAERLQDYASNHTRRSSGNEPADHGTLDDDDIIGGWSRRSTAPRRSTEFGDHNDIVDRVERALQEYRAARRILQPRQDGSAPVSGSAGGGITDSRAAVDRPYRTDAAAQDVRDSLSMLQDVVGRDTRTDTLNSGVADSTNRHSRHEPLRQRVRDRRRFINTLLDHENDDLASGPLFDAANHSREDRDDLDTNRWRADTRKMLENVRRAEARAKSKQLKQAKAALQYLAQLREEEMDDVRAWTLASELQLHNQSLEETLKKNLPMSVDALPKPAFCSWLEPGMTWTGTQSAEQEVDDAKEARTRAISDALRRARDQRDRVDLATRQNESFRARMRQGRDPLDRTLTTNNAQDALSVARNSMYVLEDAERSLSTMLERSERLLRENERQLQENEEQLSRNRERLREHDERLARLRTITPNELGTRPRQQEHRKTKDRWNVKVTLHEVDWRKMTLTGTMTASHTPNVQPNGPEKLVDETSMDSFFTGEIVDFANYGLDTTTPADRDGRAYLASAPGRKLLQDDYKVGGPEIDLTYWAGVGPFKEQVDRAIQKGLHERELARQAELTKPRPLPDVPSSGESMLSHRSVVDPNKIEPIPPDGNEVPDDSLPIILTEEDKYDIKMSTMHDLLSNTRWLNENINAQGWILMRWKERCFVAPGTEPNPEPNRPWVPSRSNAEDIDSPSNRGYLNYADLHRRRQDARNNQRIYTTNAAERDEIRGSNGASGNATGPQGSRQPTWGLTISGFYYVALHRTTGRIEALYYDSGSAPFQTLKMSPATCHGQLTPNQEDAMDVDEQVPAKQDLPIMPGGLRTNFNMVEWR